ncbi:MAG TPA: hypothetical protein VGP72_31320 [Planctomycetota bacterium]|jgi:hypothetical protein
MIRLEASLSRKLPLPGVQFSSQSFSAGISAEVSDADSPEVIKSKLQNLYALLDEAVNEQIAAAAVPTVPVPPRNRVQNLQPASPPPVAAQQTDGNGRTPKNGNGNGRRICATEAQQRAIFAITKSLGLDLQSVLADYNVGEASQLSVKQASQVIDDLKSRQAPNQPR